MNKSYEVEYCNLELRFERRHIQNLIRDLIHEGYSLYWSENDSSFIISIRTGRKLVKLRFQRLQNRYKIVGDYTIKDEKLGEFIERLIGDTRGHAVVKRFKDRQILIENILFGELIRQVEVSGMEHRVIFQKRPLVTNEEVAKAFQSKRAEERAKEVRVELDYELACLYDAMRRNDAEETEKCKEKLAELRHEMLFLEL